MTKYHIKKDGTPGICHAEKGKCPLGGAENHFSTLDEAQHVADERMSNKFVSEPSTNNGMEKLPEYLQKSLDGVNLKNSKIELVDTKAGYPQNMKITTPNGTTLELHDSTKKGSFNDLMFDTLPERTWHVRVNNPNADLSNTDFFDSNTVFEANNGVLQRIINDNETKSKNKTSSVQSLKNKINKDPNNPKNDSYRNELYAKSISNKKDPFSKKNVSNQDVVKMTEEPDGGATYDIANHKIVTSGFAYSPYPENSEVVDLKDFDENKLNEFYKKNANKISADKNVYVGIWHDPETDKVYLDLSQVVNDSSVAREDCKEKDQIAYFDMQMGQSVDVDRNAKSGQK